jgi:Xaa-Pro dipeptidase
MRYLELELLRRAAGHQNFQSCAGLLKELLIRKDDEEIHHIKRAVEIAEQAIKSLLQKPLSGQTEMEAANKLVIRLLECGSEPHLPFNPIIASGPNSANPHAVPGNRIIRSGDLVVIDWGASSGGYISDITRTFMIGQPQPQFEEMAETVHKANQAGREAVKPGIQANSIDAAARMVIADSGFGKYFTHRTGHGIGMLAHEEPYISEVSTTRLAPGMVFTVEPGVYLPGRGGVRIEDNILVTEEGNITLTSLPRELRLID